MGIYFEWADPTFDLDRMLQDMNGMENLQTIPVMSSQNLMVLQTPI